MGHGLLAAFSAALLVPSSGWIQWPLGEPYNFTETLPRVYQPVFSMQNPGPGTLHHEVGGLHSVQQTISGSSLAGPPAESGPTWTPKFTPLANDQLTTTWEVDWRIPAGWTYHVTMHYSHEVGTQTWRRGTQEAVRDRSWHTFVRQGFAEEGPGGGEPGGGG